MRYIVAGNHREYVSYIDSQAFHKTQCLECTSIDILRGRIYNPATDEIDLIGSWRDRRDLDMIFNHLETMLTIGRATRVPPRKDWKTPW